jgi:drug/metabolite transporter (DMT)-like permease
LKNFWLSAARRKINCFQANEVKHNGADYFESAFGMFFVFIDRVSSQAILWPLVAARGTSITCLLLLVHMRGEFHLPEKNQLGLMALVGLFDAAGNTFFALATRMGRLGRLDISVVLSSLYPAATVVLAWLILKERLTSTQWTGLAITAVSLVLISL